MQDTVSHNDAAERRNLSAHEVIMQIEKDGNLFSFLHMGIPLWWFVRARLLWLLKRQQTGLYLIRPAESLSAMRKIEKALDAVARCIGTRRRYPEKCDVLALSTSSARRQVTADGRAYDIFYDFLSDLPLRYTVVEFPDHTRHSSRPYSGSVVYGDLISLAGNLGRFTAGLRRPPDGVQDLARQVNRLLREHDQELDPALVNGLLRREAAYVETTRPFVRGLLDALRPRVVLTESGASSAHMVVQYEARRRGIAVLELQHGLITKDHIGYFFCLNDPALLDHSPFPDRICVYGEHFRQILGENPHLTSQHVVVTGDLHLWQECQTRGSQNRLVGSDGVLITSQPGLGRFWSRFAVDLSERLKSPVVLKPHPSECGTEDEVFREALCSKRVKVVRNNRSIYDLFFQARYHLSVFSTSHFEALAFGLNDVVVAKDNLEQQVSVLIEKGVPLAHTAEEAANVIADYPGVDVARKYVIEAMFGLHLNPLERMSDLLSSYLSAS